MYKNNKSRPSFLIHIAIYFVMATLYGCGGSDSAEENKVSNVQPPSVQSPDGEDPNIIGSWLSNCDERANSAYYVNELTFNTDSLEITEHKYGAPSCLGEPLESISQTNNLYSYPESNSDTNDKFIIVEVFKQPLWEMTVYIETYDNLLYLSNNFLITHEGFAFDSSQTSEINYVNYLTKAE